MTGEHDWLFGTEEAKEELKRRGSEIADLYLVFVETDRGKRLLEHWSTQEMYKRTPPGSPIDVYAADEAIRGFIAGIHHQIKLAQQLKET